MNDQKEKQYFTKEGVEVTQNIKDGKTFFYEEKEDAIKKAKEIRSYFYWVYDKKRVFTGYAVPK